MMHLLLHWPEQYNTNLWPFAMDHAVYIWNHLPRSRNGLSPLELFTSLKLPNYDPILRARVWGCPVYVLDPKLQDGKKLPKWTKRSRLGIYLGNSPQHSTTVGLIGNLDTGAVSPQYHVVYDKLFTTVHGHLTDAVFDSEEWNEMLNLKGLEYNVDHLDDPDRLPPFFDEFVDATDPSTDPPVPEGDGDEDETKTTDTDSTSDEEGTSESPVAPNPSPTLVRGRPRGRPRKNPLPQDNEGAPPKRPRGRPCKNPLPSQDAPR